MKRGGIGRKNPPKGKRQATIHLLLSHSRLSLHIQTNVRATRDPSVTPSPSKTDTFQSVSVSVSAFLGHFNGCNALVLEMPSVTYGSVLTNTCKFYFMTFERSPSEFYQLIRPYFIFFICMFVVISVSLSLSLFV